MRYSEVCFICNIEIGRMNSGGLLPPHTDTPISYEHLFSKKDTIHPANICGVWKHLFRHQSPQSIPVFRLCHGTDKQLIALQNDLREANGDKVS